ncbi:WD40/YVTN/BNR-like repeat-containing protein [Pedobacter petrophilus]|uniref:WD40/YVTN/BNR-like repeat-containing protein n=1 Tax=Pedobacter petrophilus TaxID=1908241 RepID=UPI001FD7D00F|nr:hypothetical protein [Pedobacter petrophilus]
MVGGNYVKDKANDNNVLLTNDGGKTWTKPVSPVLGFRSGVAYVNKNIIVATGTSGTDVSTDAGQNWKHLNDQSFNAVQKAKKGNRIFLAGEKGRIFELLIGK